MQVARRRTAGGAGVADGLALRDPLPRASGEPGQVTVGRHHATVADGDLVAVTSAVVRPLHRPGRRGTNRRAAVRPEVGAVVQLVHAGDRVYPHPVRRRDVGVGHRVVQPAGVVAGVVGVRITVGVAVSGVVPVLLLLPFLLPFLLALLALALLAFAPFALFALAPLDLVDLGLDLVALGGPCSCLGGVLVFGRLGRGDRVLAGCHQVLDVGLGRSRGLPGSQRFGLGGLGFALSTLGL